MSIFGDVANASIEGAGIKLPAGTYGLQINRMSVKKSQNAQSKQNNRLIVIIEFLVTHSDNPSVEVGSTKYSEVEHLEEQYGKNALKALVVGICGVSSQDVAGIDALAPYIDPLLLGACDMRNLFGPIGPQSPGLIVGLTKVPKVSKGNNAYGKNVWFAAPASIVAPGAQLQEAMRRLQANPAPAPQPAQQPNPFPQHAAPPAPVYPQGYGAPQPGYPPQAQGYPMQAPQPQGYPAQAPQYTPQAQGFGGQPPGPAPGFVAPMGYPPQAPPAGPPPGAVPGLAPGQGWGYNPQGGGR